MTDMIRQAQIVLRDGGEIALKTWLEDLSPEDRQKFFEEISAIVDPIRKTLHEFFTELGRQIILIINNLAESLEMLFSKIPGPVLDRPFFNHGLQAGTFLYLHGPSVEIW